MKIVIKWKSWWSDKIVIRLKLWSNENRDQMKLTFCESRLSCISAILWFPSPSGLHNLLMMDQWTHLASPGFLQHLLMDHFSSILLLPPDGSILLPPACRSLILPPDGWSLINTISLVPLHSFTAALAARFFTCQIFLLKSKFLFLICAEAVQSK